MALRCPKCRSPMEIVKTDEIEIDRCSQCHGLWFDGRELEKLRKRPGVEALDNGDASVGKKFNEIDRIACPRCTTTMVRMVAPDQPHIWFEQCSVCGGSYFDAGEFRDYVSWSPLDLFRRIFSPPRRLAWRWSLASACLTLTGLARSSHASNDRASPCVLLCLAPGCLSSPSAPWCWPATD